MTFSELGEDRYLVQAPNEAALCDLLAVCPDRRAEACGSRSIPPRSESTGTAFPRPQAVVIARMGTCLG